MQQNKPYDGPPSTFVNVKRVKIGEQDSKGREKYAFTLGLTNDQSGTEINTCDQLINALLPLQGKQVNLVFHVGEAQSADGRSFPTAFLRVTEMIPKSAGGGQTRFVPKTATPNRAADVKARAAKIQADFKG